jgi:hypothetical protein
MTIRCSRRDRSARFADGIACRHPPTPPARYADSGGGDHSRLSSRRRTHGRCPQAGSRHAVRFRGRQDRCGGARSGSRTSGFRPRASPGSLGSARRLRRRSGNATTLGRVGQPFFPSPTASHLCIVTDRRTFHCRAARRYRSNSGHGFPGGPHQPNRKCSADCLRHVHRCKDGTHISHALRAAGICRRPRVAHATQTALGSSANPVSR